MTIDRCIFEPTYPVRPSSLGQHLRKRRLDLKLQQHEVAVQLGATEPAVWGWEHNRSSPALRFMPKIIEFLGCDPFLEIT